MHADVTAAEVAVSEKFGCPNKMNHTDWPALPYKACQVPK